MSNCHCFSAHAPRSISVSMRIRCTFSHVLYSIYCICTCLLKALVCSRMCVLPSWDFERPVGLARHIFPARCQASGRELFTFIGSASSGVSGEASGSFSAFKGSADSLMSSESHLRFILSSLALQLRTTFLLHSFFHLPKSFLSSPHPPHPLLAEPKDASRP